jgi:hypothetical protein
MNTVELDLKKMSTPWDEVYAIAGALPATSWVLVGGLMVQAHACLAGMETRVTTDVDVLIDVMSSNANVISVVRGLQELEFVPQEPGLVGAAFHRMKKSELIVDILVAEHLPSRKRQAAKVGKWPILQALGGAQALERRMPVQLISHQEAREIFVPDLLGALILKAAAYSADRRDRARHLQDAALLASLMVDPVVEFERLRGSDSKRIRSIVMPLNDINHSAWQALLPEQRINGLSALKVLSGS